MIRLRSDCLEFELSNGEKVPCSAQTVTVELMGPAANSLERHIVENATAAVLHYFHVELKKTSVTLSEFTQALEIALRGMGINVVCDSAETRPTTEQADLRRLATTAGKFYELAFFAHLRDELRRRMQHGPAQLRLYGLRGCVKQLAGARRWNSRCRQLNDQIVDFIRGCLVRDTPEQPCNLLVH